MHKKLTYNNDKSNRNVKLNLSLSPESESGQFSSTVFLTFSSKPSNNDQSQIWFFILRLASPLLINDPTFLPFLGSVQLSFALSLSFHTFPIILRHNVLYSHIIYCHLSQALYFVFAFKSFLCCALCFVYLYFYVLLSIYYCFFSFRLKVSPAHGFYQLRFFQPTYCV